MVLPPSFTKGERHGKSEGREQQEKADEQEKYQRLLSGMRERAFGPD